APPSFFNHHRGALAGMLSDLSPWGSGEGGRTFFTTSGADANDDAVRMARTVTGRAKVMAAYRSFHGASGISIALSGDERRWGSEPGPSSIVRFFAPFPYRSPFHAESPTQEVSRAMEHLESILRAENPKSVAALVIEPVVGANGVIVYPEGY